MNTNLSKTEGTVYRISVSEKMGQKKENIDAVSLDDKGIINDGHWGSKRPISLLPLESFEKIDSVELKINPGAFAENITTSGLSYEDIKVGSRLELGGTIVLEVIQIGKECHHDCIIKQSVGDCIMPREGVFARVVCGGRLRPGDKIKLS